MKYKQEQISLHATIIILILWVVGGIFIDLIF